MSSEAAAPQSVGLVEVGSFMGGGLRFVDGDIPRAMEITVGNFEGRKIQLKPAKAEIVANEENGVEAEAAIPAVEVIIGEETSEQLLGAIAGLPQLRNLFVEEIADRISEAREEDETEEYAKATKSFKSALTSMEKAEAKIMELDEAAVPGFRIKDFVLWSATTAPLPRPQTVAGGTTGSSGSRKRSTVTWCLNEYIPKQRTFEGPLGAYHNVRLVKLAEGVWAVESDEGQVLTTQSPNKAKSELLIMVGMSPARSANDLWQGSQQEKAAGAIA